MSNKINLSASLLQTLSQCSLKVWFGKCQNIIDEVHWKAKIGSICHDLLEILVNSRHKNIVQKCKKTKFIQIPSIFRLINKKIKEYDLEFHRQTEDYDLIQDVEEMVKKALNYDFECKNAIKIYKPEYKFEIDVEGYNIKGFFDKFYEEKDRIVIRDYKTQKTAFNNDSLNNNFQALLYQFAIKSLFNKPSRIEFIMLRQKETSKNFVQVVEYLGDDVLNGLRSVLIQHGGYLANLNYNQACANVAANKPNLAWLCKSCGFRDPFSYYGCYKDNKLIKTSLNEQKLLKYNGIIIRLHHFGCPFHQTNL